MKKLLAIMLTIMLAFTTLLVTACNNGEQTADTSEELSSSSEEPSSTRKKGSGAASHTPSAGSALSDSSDAPIDSGSTIPDAPSSSTPDISLQYGSYNYEYSTSVVMPQGDTNQPEILLDMLIYSFYLDYPKPTLSNSGFITALKSYEEMYNGLTVTQKAAVQNYAFLLEARQAYDMMAIRQAEEFINDLPEITENNIDEFYALVEEITDLYSNVKDTSYYQSSAYSDFQSKIEAAAASTKNAFDAMVAEAEASFEYTPQYKAKLDGILDTYNRFTPAQKSAVSSSYSSLNALFTKYSDTGVILEFNAVYEKLPAVGAVTKDDKVNIELAYSMFGAMTGTQLQLLGDATAVSDNLSALKEAIKKICPEYVWARTLETNKNAKTKSFEGTNIVFDFNGASTNSGSSDFVYEGTSLKDAFTFNESRHFSVKGLPYGGKLVIYATVYNSTSSGIVVSGGSYSETKDIATGVPTEFDIPAGGDYTVSFTGGVKIFAVIFS